MRVWLGPTLVGLLTLVSTSAFAQTGASLVSQDRYVLGTVQGEGSELAVEAVLQTSLTGSAGAAEKLLVLTIRQLHTPEMSQAVRCSPADARALRDGLVGIEAAEAKPKPAYTPLYLGGGLPPPPAPFRELLWSGGDARVSLRDIDARRRLVVTVGLSRTPLTVVAAASALTEFRAFVEQGLALLQR